LSLNECWNRFRSFSISRVVLDALRTMRHPVAA
jgi:hypothetical protein